MFRKSRKSSASAAPSSSNAPRFFQHHENTMGDFAELGQIAAFSVGVEEGGGGCRSKASNSLGGGLFSRIFCRSKEKLASTESLKKDGESIKKPSIWQRSKSILRPRTQLDRSESTLIDFVPISSQDELEIYGSGSAAELLIAKYVAEGVDLEGCVDHDQLLNRIFEANNIIYEQLKASPREKENEKEEEDEEGIITPALTVITLAEVEKPIVTDDFRVPLAKFLDDGTVPSTIHSIRQNHSSGLGGVFEDDPQLDSPLLAVGDEDDYDDSSSEESFESSIKSFNSGVHDLNDVENLSLEDLAGMFDCLRVAEPEVLADGAIRCVVEGEAGSVESIRFYDWKNDAGMSGRLCRSEDQLKMTKIGVASGATLNKARSQSTTLNNNNNNHNNNNNNNNNNNIDLNEEENVGGWRQVVNQLVSKFGRST